MSRVVITEEPDEVEEDRGVAGRHPDLAYVFGDMIKAFYVVGCLALDLLTPLQVLDWLPGHPLWAVPPLFLLFASLAYVEYRLYRRLWPPRTKRKIVEE
jgi:hypothetical protein